MGTLYTRPYGFQIRITNKLLPKDLWATFDTREAAEQYMSQLEGLLAQGIVPQSLLERASVRQEIWTVQRCIVEYVRHNPVPLSDRKLLDTIGPSVATNPTSALEKEMQSVVANEAGVPFNRIRAHGRWINRIGRLHIATSRYLFTHEWRLFWRRPPWTRGYRIIFSCRSSLICGCWR